MTVNADVKAAARNKNVCLWQVAEVLGIADTTMSRKLRRELSDVEKQKMFAIIDELAATAAK